MATETYKWFQPEATNLRADYGSDAILDNGDSAEITPESLTIRHICNELSLPKNYTNQLFKIGTDSGANTWVRVSDETYSSISSYLTSSETTSVVSSSPSGWSVSSTQAYFQPRGRGTTVIVNGDSITDALGITSNNKKLIYAAQAIDSISGETLANIESSADRTLQSKNYRLINMALGGSSWANTIDQGNNEDLYPLPESLRFNQRTRTLPLNADATNNVFSYWLGTNDLSYDATLTGAQCWTRATTRITAFRAQFPNIPLILCTAIKRSESSALNDRINDYNVLMRANYSSAGVDALADFENEVSVVNISTGDTTNTTYYTDGVHITETTHGLLAPVFLTALNSVT